jgi:thioredoxin-like negative regulator of GroEL
VFLTDENFTAVTSHPQRYKFVKLFTPWCRYCRVLKEVVKELKNQLVERKDIEFYEVNCHLNQNTCFQLQAFSFPMTVIYGADGHLKDRIVGAMPLQVMREFVDRNTQEVFKVGGNA